MARALRVRGNALEDDGVLERLYVLFDERHQFVEIGERMLDAGADVLHSASPTLWLHTFIFVDYDPK